MDILKQKMKKYMKVILIVCLLIYPVMSNVLNAKAYTSFQYLGKIYDKQGKYGDATVGNFLVDGQQAFCVEHDKLTPGNGTAFTENPYEDPQFAKALFYGYAGAKPWSGV